jgi:ribose 5-phosphate isomerase B
VPRPVLTAQDLEKIADGGEIVIAPDTLITPLARDTAEQRQIQIRIEQPKAEFASSNRAQIVALGADHGGYALKEQLKNYLRDWGYTPLDLGTDSTEPVDYPDFAEIVANAVVRGDAWRGVVVDSAGIGSAIAANKVPGARAALCYDRASAKNSREHNDANILTLGAKMISEETAREILAQWLATDFAAGRHQKRIDKIRAIETRHQIRGAQ